MNGPDQPARSEPLDTPTPEPDAPPTPASTNTPAPVPEFTGPTSQTPPTAPADAGARRKTRWSRSGVILTTALTVIGTVASVIGVIQVFTRDTSNFAHLSVTASPAADSVSEWALPESAVDSLPASMDGPCGAAQRSWLEANAEPIQRRLLLTTRNAATDGAMLALTDIRSTATRPSERGPLSVRVVCDPTGRIPELLYYGRVDADDPASSARHVEIKAALPANAAPAIPVTYNLAPGESGQIPIELFSRYPVSGTLEVTVHSGSDERRVTIKESQFTVPALLFGGDMYLFTAEEGLVCLLVEAGSLSACTTDQVKSELTAAQR